MSLVTTSEHRQTRYTLLTPTYVAPRQGDTYNIHATTEDVPVVLELLAKSKYVALDLETRGSDYSSDIEIIGIGLAWDTGSCYFEYSQVFCTNLLQQISKHSGLIAHNVYFDGGVIYKVAGLTLRWHMCTYALLAHLANEGHPDQSWGLKTAQVELLLWADSNEHELGEWLVANGHYRGVRRVDSTPEFLIQEYYAGKLSPQWAEMWQAPASILGKYCLLDAESTYLLYTAILLPALERFPGLQMQMQDCMYLIEQLIKQKVAGILVDRKAFLDRQTYLNQQIQDLGLQFINHSSVHKYVQELEQQMRAEILNREPEKYRKQTWPVEPAKYKKDGTLAKSWTNWYERTEEMKRKGPDISKNWIKWKAQLDAAERGELPEYCFNLQSGPQLRTLLYDKLGHEIRVRSEATEQFPNGQPAVGTKALKHMGEAGGILVERGYLVKELSYLVKYIELTEGRNTIHPSFRTPGTMTGRLSSKEPNLQQLPKTKAMMSPWIARPGYKFVDLDISALEPNIITEFSKDENMWKIYGPGAPKNDLYLYVAAHTDVYGPAIRATGYDPLNPTPEGLARAKKECKHERTVAKVVALACGYGASVNKVNQILEQDDIFLEYSEVELIHTTYWKLFAGVQDFSRALYYEWRRNRGYIINGVGRPMCVPDNMTKDLLNRFTQSTGHDVFIQYIRIYTQELVRRGIPYTPIIIDLHDATTVEVPEQYAEETAEVMLWGLEQLNRELQGKIPLRGVPLIGSNLADVKEPEE